MNAPRDPDRRINAWLELMPDEAPDRVIAAVQQAVERVPQVRRPLALAVWRLPHMNRLILVAAAIVAVVGASLYVLRPSSNVGGQPSPSPTLPSPAPATLPSSIRSTWLADAGPIEGLGTTATRLRLVVLGDGTGLHVTIDQGIAPRDALPSKPIGGTAAEIDIASTIDKSGCTGGEVGRYAITVSPDGLFLTLTAISEDCGSRFEALSRTWVRAVDGASEGGRGIVAQFDPAMLITLPAASYVSQPAPDAATITSVSPDRTFIAVKNPAGFAAPCSTDGGTKLPVAHTISAFSTYLDGLPGLAVQSQPLTIDGHPAAHLTIPVAVTADCPGGRVFEWAQGDVASTGGWFIRQGDTDVVYLVQVGSDLYLLQWLGAGVTPAEELSVLSTVHFLSGLPTPG